MLKRFKESSMERRIESIETRKEEVGKLRRLLGDIRDILKRQGIDVDENCRIDINTFEDVYESKEINKDQECVEEVYGGKDDKLLTDGERFEALKTIVFYKFLNKKFIVTRTAPYDDAQNHVDNLIVEKETGDIVCAFDEVSAISSPEFIKKQERFLRNNINGAKVKYGILSTKDGLIKGKIENIPIFYLALPPERINEGIKNLTSLEEISDYEEKLWAYFVATLQSQIARLKLENLNEILKHRLLEFEKNIKK